MIKAQGKPATEISQDQKMKSVPEVGSLPEKEEPKKPTNYWQVAFFLLLFLLLIGGGVFGYYRFFKERGQEETTFSTPATVLSPQPSRELGNIAENKIFFVKDSNIYSYNLEGSATERWTDYPQNPKSSPAYDSEGKQIPNIAINDLQVIDKETLGFSKCNVITGDFGCGLYLLDLKTKEVKETKRFTKEIQLEKSGWSFDKEKYAYLTTGMTKDSRWQLHLVNNQEERLIINLENALTGRGGFLEDSQKIAFSPKGHHFLQIATSSPRSIEDFNTYLYEVATGEEIAIISDSTQPSWIDNERIIFRRYDKENPERNGIYLYNIDSQAEEKLSLSNDSYWPEYNSLQKAIVYWTDNDKTLRLYNLESGEDKELLKSAIYGFWATPNKIVYEEVLPCEEGEACGGMVDFEVKGIRLFNIVTNQSEALSEIKGLYRSASSYHQY